MVRMNRPQNKNHLKSDRDSTMSRNPAVREDQYGSKHNADEVKASQRQRGRPGGKHDLSFRESSQDSRTNGRGVKNKLPGRRFKQRGAKATARKK